MTDTTFFLMPPFDDAALVALVTGVPLDADDPAGARVAGDRSGLVVTIPSAACDRWLFWLAVHGAHPRAGSARAVGEGVPVQVCAAPDGPLAGHAFDGPLDATWRAIWHAAVPEILSVMGWQDSATVRARLPMIWARASSRLRGQATSRRSLSGLDARHVRVASVDRPYARFFTVEDMTYSHDRFDGTDSGPLDRAVFVGADAVTLLPWDPVRDRVLVIEQMRAAPLARADPQPWLIEPVAGRIDPGETPENAARRETAEEAGITVAALHEVGAYYPTTSAFSEYLFSFVGIADLPDDAAGLGGLASEAEDIRGHVMPRARLMDLIADGQAPVGPLHLSALWLALNADRLRGRG